MLAGRRARGGRGERVPASRRDGRATALRARGGARARDGRRRTAACSRSSLAGRSSPRRLARRAAAEGCDLSAGWSCRSPTSARGRPREALSVVASELPRCARGAGRRRALRALPAGRGGPRARSARGGLARSGCAPYGLTGTSSHYGDAAEIARAVRGGRDGAGGARRRTRPPRGPRGRTAGSGVYRLLFRVLASRPRGGAQLLRGHGRAAGRHDEQYRGDLLPTLESYLGNDCNMNATARAIYAHRHTVAYRLERVRELTGLDPAATRGPRAAGPRPEGAADRGGARLT